MNNFRTKLKSSGYDQEEAYFYERDKELIEKIKEEKRGDRKLTLVQGGKKEEDQKPLPRGLSKKAA